MAGELRFIEPAMRELTHDPDGPLGRELAAIGQRVQTAARELAPYRTGELRSQIQTEVARDPAGGVELDITSQATNLTGFPYGQLQEFRQPYLRPAVDEAIRR